MTFGELTLRSIWFGVGCAALLAGAWFGWSAYSGMVGR